MTRQIKFRAWDKHEKRMMTKINVMHFSEAHENGIEQVYGYNPTKESTSEADWVVMDNLVLMQFTELKDKNKKDIYESDLVEGVTFQGLCLGVVEHSPIYGYYVRYFRTLAKEYNETLEFIDHNSDLSDTEVIGNIYENPELLTPAKD